MSIETIRLLKEQALIPKQKRIYTIPKKSAKKIEQEKITRTIKPIINKANNEDLKEWFKYHMENSPKRCENCNANLNHLSNKDWYNCQHHILEKSLFPSIQSELLNHAVLGYYCCHGQWHSSYQNAQEMPIWSELKQRVKPILHLIKEHHKILELFK
jgi:hypothetical protein